MKNVLVGISKGYWYCELQHNNSTLRNQATSMKGLVKGKQLGMVRYKCRDHSQVLCIRIWTGRLRNFLVKSDPD